jgi:hypothetical protein
MKRAIQSTAALLLAGVALFATAHADSPAKPSKDAQTDRLTDLMVELVTTRSGRCRKSPMR